MEIAQDKIDLISKIIRNDRKFPGNEDLFDDFLNETCQRSVSILGTIENESTLSTYLRRVANSAIVTVLKDSGRLRRTKTGYMSTHEVVADTQKQEEVIDYSSFNISYANIEVPISPEEIVIQKEILEFVIESIKKIDSEESDKKYLDIYTLRYDKGLTQSEIANELNISQSEVSKRLYKLIDKVKDIIE